MTDIETSPPARLFRSHSVTRAIREIVIVVVGILIAFGLDAAWERRNKAAEERAHLRALASDFDENVRRLRAHVRTEDRISTSSQALLAIAQRNGPLPTDSVTHLMGMVFNSSRYEPVMGAYEALVNSAGLTLIEDDTLRAALANFSARVNGRYAERWSDELYLSFIKEFTGRMRFIEDPETGARPADKYDPLLRDPKFQDYLALRYLGERDVARRYRALLAEAEAIAARLPKDRTSKDP